MTYDLAVGADVSIVNRVAEEVYGQLYPQYFTGSLPYDAGGTPTTVTWDVRTAPVFDLTSPAYSDEELRAHFTQGAAGPSGAGRSVRFTEDEVAEHAAALGASLDGRTFQAVLHQVHVTVDTGDGEDLVQGEVTVTVDIQASTSRSGLLTLNPVKAVASDSTEVQKVILDNVVLPAVLDQARGILSGIEVPAPDIPLLNLSAPVPVIQPEQAVAAMNLVEHGVPQPPFPDDWPTGPFFALIGTDTVQRITEAATAYLEGQSFPAGDSADFVVGTGYYQATIVIDEVRCEVLDTEVPTVSVQASVTGSGSAGIKWLWGGSTDAFYDLRLEPDPTVTLTLSMSGTTLTATTDRVSSFDLEIYPHDDLVSIIASWVADALSSTLGGLVGDAFQGIAFTLGDLPAVTIDVDPVRLAVTPTDLSLGRFGDALSLQGDISIDGR
ncbi:hypothetical protein [Streptomyces yaizuensis]|uniref:Uncharacterized protein n=1 Tax=Streptomyces yaizuensis TaxID=2989713 RepID=A0ABQ5NSA4_9ACTN|nr:hypothetical protein [Streptomyces sp. YSPA8]GLF93253.1 hypothetical protein SYYSPA8_03170 [Streptomyces sp. YSPA8]